MSAKQRTLLTKLSCLYTLMMMTIKGGRKDFQGGKCLRETFVLKNAMHKVQLHLRSNTGKHSSKQTQKIFCNCSRMLHAILVS